MGLEDKGLGVIVPDFPGCFSAADGGIEGVIDQVKEAIKLWIEFAIYRNEEMPPSSELIELQQRGGVWGNGPGYRVHLGRQGRTIILLLSGRYKGDQAAKAHGMAEVARNAALGEKTLFKSLSDDGNSTLETINKILHSVGLRLSVVASGLKLNIA